MPTVELSSTYVYAWPVLCYVLSVAMLLMESMVAAMLLLWALPVRRLLLLFLVLLAGSVVVMVLMWARS